MDLTQSKLNKEEWTALEVPLPEDERKILRMIHHGWENPDITSNDANSIISMMRITENMKQSIFYEMYFKEKILSMSKKYNLSWKKKKNKKKKMKLKKKEEIRIKNFDKKMGSSKDSIYEFILLKNVKSFLSYYKSKNVSKYIYYYYNLSQLILNNISHINTIFGLCKIYFGRI